MKYLFFDIECAVVFKNVAKICAFGYCLVDEQFHILEKNDILVNPQGKFHLTDRKGRKGLVLPYEYEKFTNYPVFPRISKKIRALLQDEDTLVCGHATMNDVKFLNLETGRFHLPSFRFSFADTQFLYMNIIGDFTRQYGLGAIAERLGVEFVPHRAVDDAYATMELAKAMCQAEGVGLLQLIEKYEVALGRIENYEMKPCTSKAYEAHLLEVAKRKEEREKNRAKLHVFIDREKRKRKKNGPLKDKIVCFSHVLETDVDLGKRLARAIFEKGAWITGKAEECNVYVHHENESGPRIQSAKNKNATLMTAVELEDYLKKA